MRTQLVAYVKEKDKLSDSALMISIMKKIALYNEEKNRRNNAITVYSHLQACGIINDHEEKCFRYKELKEKMI